MAPPRFRQIADDLREKIRSGELRPLAQLPTELDLREQYDASRNTIRDAVRLLIQEGLVETQAGRGTFVVDKIDPFLTTLTPKLKAGAGGGEGVPYLYEVQEQGRKPKNTTPRVEIQPISDIDREVGRELRLDAAAGADADGEVPQVVSRHQQRFIDGKPYSLQTSFYPFEFVTKGATRLIQATNIDPGAVKYLEDTLGIRQVGYRDRILVRFPDDNERAFFDLPDIGVMLVTYRTAYDQDGHPFRLTVSVFPADRNEFVINVGDVPATPPAQGPAEKKG